MKLLIVGATGPTGQQLVNESLDKGHEVIALVRNPDKLTPVQNDHFKVIKGNILDAAELAEHMRGCDAVLSALGGRPGIFVPCDIYSKSGEALVKAMRETGVNRLVAVTAWGTKDDPGLPFIWRWVLKPSFLRNIVRDMEMFEDYLTNEGSDINYTVVRPPKLEFTPSTGEKTMVTEGMFVPGATKSAITRQDLAKFMLECLETQEYDRKMVAVCSS